MRIVLKASVIHNQKLLALRRERQLINCVGCGGGYRAKDRGDFKTAFVAKPLFSDIEPGPFHN